LNAVAQELLKKQQEETQHQELAKQQQEKEKLEKEIELVRQQEEENKRKQEELAKQQQNQEIEEITESRYVLNGILVDTIVLGNMEIEGDKIFVTADQKLYMLQSLNQDAITKIIQHIGKNYIVPHNKNQPPYVLITFKDKNNKDQTIQIHSIKTNDIKKTSAMYAYMKNHPFIAGAGIFSTVAAVALIAAYFTDRLDIIASITQPGIDAILQLLQQATDLMRKK